MYVCIFFVIYFYKKFKTYFFFQIKLYLIILYIIQLHVINFTGNIIRFNLVLHKNCHYNYRLEINGY